MGYPILLPNNPCDTGDYWPAFPRFPAHPHAPKLPAQEVPEFPAEPDGSIPAEPVIPPSSLPQGNPGIFSWGSSDSPDYPWATPTLSIKNYPTPGMFFEGHSAGVSFQHMDRFVRAALGSALSMAGADVSLATSNTAVGRRLRNQLLELIQCSKWNDALYGSADTGAPGSQGRGISWTQSHANIFKLLSQGRSPVRTVDLQGRRLPKYLEANLLPFVWVPAVDLAALQGGNPQILPLTWRDGVSTQEPPPQVRRYAVDQSGVQLPGGAGCPVQRHMSRYR